MTPELSFPSPDFFRIFMATPGAISLNEACCIAHLASQIPDEGIILECGSNAGKSSMSACEGIARRGQPRVFNAIDPVFDLTNTEAISHTAQKTVEGIGWSWVKEPDFKYKFQERIKNVSSGLVEAKFWGDISMRAIPQILSDGGKVAWAFIDSNNHEIDLVRSECQLLTEHMAKGGIIAWHDIHSQFQAPEIVYREMMATGLWEEMPCPYDQINPWVEANYDEMLNQSWHHRETKNPNFVAALRYIRK